MANWYHGNSNDLPRLYGRYLLAEQVDREGAYTRFRARQVGEPGWVVVKCFSPECTEDPELVQRFWDMGQVLLRLEHPHLLQTYDMGEHGGLLFLVTETVRGLDLPWLVAAAERRRVGLPDSVAAHLCAQAAAALGYLHEQQAERWGEPRGLTYGQLKPRDIWVAPEGRITLVEAGSSMLELKPDPDSVGVLRHQLDNLSPEQVKGLPVDGRSDLFALGVVLYELTTGRHPFRWQDQISTLTAIIKNDPVPPHELREDYPPELERVVLRCLAKDPEARYQRAEQVRAELQAFGTTALAERDDEAAAWVEDVMKAPEPQERHPERKAPPTAPGKAARQRVLETAEELERLFNSRE